MSKPIETEGVLLDIDWGKFIVGSSFFVPCIDTHAVRVQIEKHATARGMQIRTRDRIENTFWGVRIWRVS